MHHKRGRAKNQRAGCYCSNKDQKHNGWMRRIKVKGLRAPRKRSDLDDGRI